MLRAFTSSLHRAARATGPHRALSACRPASTTSTVVQVPAGEYAIGSWKESRLESELGGLFKTHGFVSGHWRSGSGNTFAVHDPATGDLIAECSDLTGEDASEAVHVAAEAMPAWSVSARGGRSNARVLHRGFLSLLLPGCFVFPNPETSIGTTLHPRM